MASGLQWVVAGVVGVAVGWALGGLPNQARIRTLQAELAQAGDCEARGIGTEIVSAIHRNSLRGEPPVVVPDPPPPAAVPPQPEPPPEPSDDGGFNVEFEVGGDEPDEQWDDGPSSLGAAKTALRVRQTQAWAALEEDAAPDDAQLDTIEDAIDAMNADLHNLTDGFLEMAEAGDVTRRDILAYGADVLDVFIDADDALYEALDDEQREVVQEESIDPFSYIDPELIDLFGRLGELDR